jgi:hypothetical protein
MPVLPNPRHEAFAQRFFAGLANGITQHEAYKAVGYRGSTLNSAKSGASRLMSTIVNRVKELQAEALERERPDIDVSRQRVGRRLDLASRMAEKQENPSAIAQNELGIAKVFGHIGLDIDQGKQSFAQAKSMREIGKRLLQSIGFSEPDDVSIQAAIEANDAFIAALEAIRDAAQGLTIDQGTD